MGQWSDPYNCRIEALTDPAEVTMLLETKNLSNMEEIFFRIPPIIISEDTISSFKIQQIAILH